MYDCANDSLDALALSMFNGYIIATVLVASHDLLPTISN